MIRINLLGETIDNSQRNSLQLLGFFGGVFLVVLCCGWAQHSVNAKLELARSDSARLDRELTALQKVTKEVQDLEKNKRLLNEKIVTIANLRAKKHGPVHTIDDLNDAIPERAWLISAKEKSNSLEINGIALDDQTISDFMQNLDKSKYFGMPELIISTQQVVDNVKLKQFTLTAPMENPFVREIPKEEPKAAAPAADKGAGKAKAKKPKLDI